MRKSYQFSFPILYRNNFHVYNESQRERRRHFTLHSNLPVHNYSTGNIQRPTFQMPTLEIPYQIKLLTDINLEITLFATMFSYFHFATNIFCSVMNVQEVKKYAKHNIWVLYQFLLKVL
jgi:hypothetical protein